MYILKDMKDLYYSELIYPIKNQTIYFDKSKKLKIKQLENMFLE